MKHYFIHNGSDKEGPFDKDELRAKVIKPNTPVWCEGMPDWTEASKVEELKDLFSTPPPYNSSGTPPRRESTASAKDSSQRNSNRRIGKALQLIGLVGVLLIGGFLLIGWLMDSGSSGSTYAEKVMTVEEIEQKDPTRFLEASGTWNENFWGTKLKVHGKVKSSATVATYKDIVIRVTYYSETRTVLGTEDYVLYKFVPPHSTVDFEWTLKRPDACKQIGWDVIRASSTNLIQR